MKFILTVLSSFLCLFLQGQKIHYNVATQKPQTHYANVSINIEDWKSKTLRITMPSWTPGSYLMREFAKSVDQVTAVSSGTTLAVQKIDKNTWEVNTKGFRNITINYPVYCNELSVRTSFVDVSHAYFNATSLLMYIEGHKEKEGTVTFQKHENFSKITTALPQGSDPETFVFEDYDQLADCPVEIGNHNIFSFEAAGVKHTVAMYGKGNYDVDKLKSDMARICQAATDVFGENPNKEYTFIIHNLTHGSGGLEHKNATTLQVNRWTYQGDDYLGFLSLVAHEYFHLWNVKRIRPEVLGPFKYDEENYTSMLWVMEGFTSYYDELLLYRAGYYTKDQYLNKLFGTINYVESLPGNKVQPVAHASFDAWIKAYRPNENSRNTTISYYSKGSIIAALLDLKIIEHTNGQKNLDNFLQALYAQYKKTGSGFTEETFIETLEEFTGNIDSFYKKYVFGTTEIPYEDFFTVVGIETTKEESTDPYLGFYTQNDGGQYIVQSVRRNGAAYAGGINVNDEILAVDEWRYSDETLDQVLKTKQLGDEINFIVARDMHILNLSFIISSKRYPRVLIVSNTENKLQQKWLK